MRFLTSPMLLLPLLLLSSQATGQEPRQMWPATSVQLLNWTADANSHFSVHSDLGTSALAYDGRTHAVYSACEKYPQLLQFTNPFQKSEPVPIAVRVALEKGVDIEAMSVFEDTIYLVDEDDLSIYSIDLTNTHHQKRLKIVDSVGIDKRSTTKNLTDLKSIEGLVVTDKFMVQSPNSSPPTGPYFYLLDELDMVATGDYRARLYICVQGNNGNIERCAPTIDFALNRDGSQRLPELFMYNGELFAIRSTFTDGRGIYEIVRLILGPRASLEQISDLSGLSHLSKRFNLEGAVVGIDGALFLITDNEDRYKTSTSEPALKLGVKDNDDMGNGVRGKTVFFTLRLHSE